MVPNLAMVAFTIFHIVPNVHTNKVIAFGTMNIKTNIGAPMLNN